MERLICAVPSTKVSPKKRMAAIVGALGERFGFTGGMNAIFIIIALPVMFSTLNRTVKIRLPEQKAQNTAHI
ncbi:MAG: hypothetical protein SOV75_08085 [Candidatus Limiplasma sp.]|nr:hypothetical protein [Candidatus Limiplasma sp.]